MPKNKVRKTIAKRIRISARGKLIYKHPGTSHLRSKENSSTQGRKNLDGQVAKPFRHQVRKLLGI